MVKNYFRIVLLLTLLSSGSLIAQQHDVWRQTDLNFSEVRHENKYQDKKEYQAFELELEDLKNRLHAGLHILNDAKQSKMEVRFPYKGRMVSFLVKESSVMHPDLAQKFPNNKSYSGRAVDNSSVKINFSVNALGLHAMIRDSSGKVYYIDPIRVKDQSNKRLYQLYNREDIVSPNKGFSCNIEQVEYSLQQGKTSVKNNDQKLRTYQLALAVTGEYSQFHIVDQNAEGASEAEQRTIVMSAMETALTRINALFLNDLAVQLQLTAGNEKLIYLDPDTDPYTNDQLGIMLNENQKNCDSTIGPENYDLGHVFSTYEEGGVTEAIGIVCRDGLKARAVTGSALPKGDRFYFDYVAHEFGHQFGAYHTFNGDLGYCDGSTNRTSSMEPGSGSTIMGYAGLCAEQNVQLQSDLYFHSVSIKEIGYFVSGAGESCAKVTALEDNRTAPSAAAGDDFTIPIGTAFKLVGKGEDADNDLLSYCWEQIDNLIGRVPPTGKDKIGTLYRSYPPVESETRYLPALKEMKNGLLSTRWEVTPEVSRELNFSLTVRDNNTEAGQVAMDELKVTVTDAAGPFKVISHNTSNLVLKQNSDQLVEWDVAGTDANGLNVSRVNILLSTDGGLSFPTVLASETNNDGSELIRLPFFTAGTCYIMVEAVDNFFFALNKKAFSIGENNNFCDDQTSFDAPLLIPDNDLGGVISSLTIEEDMYIEDLTVSVEIEHSKVSDVTIELESPEGTKSALLIKACSGRRSDIKVEFSDRGEVLSCNSSSPEISGVIKPVVPLTSFAGENARGKWKLKVVDSTINEVGSLLSWGITICSYDEVLAAKDFKLKGFNLYPNPTDDSFELSFDLKAAQVELILYDALGRSVLQKSFESNALRFRERIHTSHLKAGLYFLKIVHGKDVVMKRVLIK
ncbi:reprolysin-like metallopeptidase [Lutimonas sp.]|uniref:reprolysin-like metallopeptidase n=1 Tax=Lutimonas sp. TaxID=1872403 RepID=UPI003D9B660C